MQENIEARKETLRVAYEEIKKLRADLLLEGESMDKNKTRVLSPKSVEEVRHFELQELCLRGATASKCMVGASRDATTEEIASWSLEADRIELEISGKRKIQEAVEKETTKDDIKMSDGGMDGLDGSLSS